MKYIEKYIKHTNDQIIIKWTFYKVTKVKKQNIGSIVWFVIGEMMAGMADRRMLCRDYVSGHRRARAPFPSLPGNSGEHWEFPSLGLLFVRLFLFLAVNITLDFSWNIWKNNKIFKHRCSSTTCTMLYIL